MAPGNREQAAAGKAGAMTGGKAAGVEEEVAETRVRAKGTCEGQTGRTGREWRGGRRRQPKKGMGRWWGRKPRRGAAGGGGGDCSGGSGGGSGKGDGSGPIVAPSERGRCRLRVPQRGGAPLRSKLLRSEAHLTAHRSGMRVEPYMWYSWTNLTYGRYLWSSYRFKLCERKLTWVSGGTRSMRRQTHHPARGAETSHPAQSYVHEHLASGPRPLGALGRGAEM